MSGTEEYDNVSHIISSRYRIIVIDALRRRPCTPSTIADQQDVGIAHVSKALTNLRERDIVDLVVPDDRRKGRIYALTDDGEDLLEAYDEVNGGAGGDA